MTSWCGRLPRVLLGLVLVLFGQACSNPKIVLEEIPVPDGLTSMEEKIRQQYESRWEALAAVEAQRDSSPAARARAWADLSNWFHAHRFLTTAAVGYRNAVRLEPTEPAWRYLQAVVLLRLSQPEESRSLLLSVVESADYVPALVSLGGLEFDLGSLDEARRYFDRALVLEPSCLPARNGLARVAREEGDIRGAIEAYRVILHAVPDATPVHYALAMAARDAGDLDLARRHFDRARIRSNDERVVLPLDDPWMEDVERLRRERSTSRLKAAERLFETGRFEDSKQRLVDLLADDGEDPHVYFLLGLVERKLGDFAAAREHLRVAADGLPDYPPIHHQLGVLTETDAPGEARSHFLRALELDPDFQRARFRLASLERQSGNCEAALVHYSGLLNSEPTHAGARFGHVACLLYKGHWESALAELEVATASRPDASALQHLLARVLATIPNDGLRDGGRALSLVRFSPGSRVHYQQIETLAMAYAAQGKFPDAVRWQERAVEAVEGSERIDPEAARARLARYRSGRSAERTWERGEPETLSRLHREPTGAEDRQAFPEVQ